MLDLRDSILHISGDEIPLQKTVSCSAASANVYRSVLNTSISLPPHSECVAPARVEGLLSSELKWGILEPQTKDATCALQGLTVGRTLVILHQITAVVRLMNLSGQRHKLKKCTEIANCEPVGSVHMPQERVQDPGHTASVLPEHLRDLYERSTTGLLPDQCQQVHNLLSRYSHIFSTGPQDTQGAMPIRQPHC